MGLEALRRMQHRGATGADPDTGDGAGLMLQLPDRFFRRWAQEELSLRLPAPGDYAVAMAFLPREPSLRLRCEELMVRIAVSEGQKPLGWRTVPVRSEAIGTLARQTEPAIRQLVIGRGRDVTPGAFRRKLTVIRRRVELAAAARRIPEESFCIPSISNATLTYKGLLMASQLAAYYPDLEEPEFESAIAVVHSRFSTNTLGTWDLAQPFNLLAHNGEINTVRGNRSWMNAREPLLRSALLGDDLQKLFPIIEDRWSDSAALDAALELLTVAGRNPAHALSMLVPAAWTGDEEMPDEVKAFYEYHATIVEPWDGPAALAFCDGRYVGALLDRNGLRPARYQVTRDGLVVMASEVGVLDLDPADVVVSDRVAPGRMLLVDTAAGRIVPDEELKRELATRRPYRHLLNRQKLYLEDLPPASSTDPGPVQPLELMQRAFGYTREDLDLLVAPMAADGQEPVASMGVDTPLAVLSERPQLLPAFFKQHFAQVTNPAIDPQREGLVMSLRTVLGAQANLLDEVPDSERRVILSRPLLLPGDIEKLYALPPDQFKVGRISCLYDPAGGGDALERQLDAICREASRLVRRGHGVIVLSDRGVDEQRAPIPMLLATAAVHSHLVREGSRSRTSVVVESGEPREVMHYALLVGFGAAAIMPYLAFETVAALHAIGEAGGGSPDDAQERYVQAVSKGLLKVLAKMGISTVQSYRGAAIFEAVGLGEEVAARFFPSTPSRVGGVGLEEIAADAATRHAAAFGGDQIDAGGLYRFRIGGEAHVWDPPTIVALQRSVRDGSRNGFRAYCEAVDGASAAAGTLRSLLTVKAAGEPVPLDDVEPASDI